MTANEASDGVSGLEKLIFEHSPDDVDTRLRMLIAALRDGDERDKKLPKDVYVQLIKKVFHHHDQRIIAEAELKARLTELDLLEQAINTGWDMNKFKLYRLNELTTKLDALTAQQDGRGEQK